MPTRVKICGITSIRDAQVVSDSGADAIGLVFYPRSPRHVTIEQAAEIVAAIPPFVTTVALFLDARAEDIRAVLEQVPVDLIQFHGDECPPECGQYGRPYIKAIGMKGGTNAQAYADTYPDARGFLLDSHAVGEAGGTGQRFDWSMTPELGKPVILAGGLNPDNAAEAVTIARPFGLDVSSGVESEPGIKDPEKVHRFMNEVRRANEC
jgi:phosphoribosylanthranilate isomerase